MALSTYTRLYGTPHPDLYSKIAGSCAIVAVMATVGLAFIAPLDDAWLPLLLLIPAAQLGWTARKSRGHEDEIRSAQRAATGRREAAIRKHPVMWAIAIPTFVVLDAALRMDRFNSPSRNGWMFGLTAALIFGSAVSAYAVHHALRRR